MGRPAERWPTFALENLEDSLFRLKQLERKLDSAQDAILLGDNAAAIKDLGDGRVLALECVENLVRSRIGKYQQQEKPSKWNRPTEDQATHAVKQVVATRRP